MQFQFYTLMVFDDHKNGVPGAWVISSSGTQVDVAKWLTALKERMLKADATWAPSCFLVDDARAEINAIRLISNP